MRALGVLCSVFVIGCAIPALDAVEGYACNADHPCPAGFHCSTAGVCTRANDDAGSTDGGADDTLRCLEPAERAPSCPEGGHWYISPNGLKANDGRTPTAPHDSASDLAVQPGDVVHFLTGTYTGELGIPAGLSGAPGCPVTLEGEADAGTVIQGTLAFGFDTANLVVRNMLFEGGADDSISVASTSALVIERSVFRPRGVPGPGRDVDFYLGECANCVVRNSDFITQSGRSPLSTYGGSTNLLFLGNRVRLTAGAYFAFAAPGATIDSCDFFGSCLNTVLSFTSTSGAAVVKRSVFHNLSCADGQPFIKGASEVSHNTFSQFVGGAPLAAALSIHNNLVTGASWAFDAPPSVGAYNLFDTTISRPYRDAGVGVGDVVAVVSFQADAGFTPAMGSAAIDQADPTSAVPLGGGARADIGAVERGAVSRTDGLQCLADGGIP